MLCVRLLFIVDVDPMTCYITMLWNLVVQPLRVVRTVVLELSSDFLCNCVPVLYVLPMRIIQPHWKYICELFTKPTETSSTQAKIARVTIFVYELLAKLTVFFLFTETNKKESICSCPSPKREICSIWFFYPIISEKAWDFTKQTGTNIGPGVPDHDNKINL